MPPLEPRGPGDRPSATASERRSGLTHRPVVDPGSVDAEERAVLPLLTVLPVAHEVRAELERVIASPEFSASERDRKFLRYVVEETLAGRADRIKGYSIGTEVFGRDASFDAQSDPVVRIEAGRLRRALERYYLMDGRTDAIHIDIPKGAYVPTFRRRTPASVEAPAASEAPPQNPSAAASRA